MSTLLRVLILEDNIYDAELEIATLEGAGYQCQWQRVEIGAEFMACLDKPEYDLILADYNLPAFNGLTALKLCFERNLEIPFILVSGKLGEEVAIESLKAGATDYVLKNRLSRLGPVVKRALQEKEQQRQRRQAETELAHFFNLSLDMLCIAGLDGYLKRINPAFEKTLGYTNSELLAKPLLDFVHPDDQAETVAQFQNLLAGRPIPHFENRCCCQNGTYKWLAWTITPATEQGLFYAVAHDITHRRALEEQLRQSQKMEAIGRLAGGVAHDFNNILTIIAGYSELLLHRHLDDEHTPQRRDVEQIEKAAYRASSLTRQLLAFSRQQVLEPQVLELKEIIKDMGKMLPRLIGEDIELVTLLTPDPIYVEADPGQIEQVVMNLVVNARDAMPRGGKLTIEIAPVELDESYARDHVGVKPNRYARLAISDTGHGIDKKTCAHIFDPFFTTKAEGKGTGMGLSTVHGIVTQSNGHIWVYSELNLGTTFKIYLPQVKATTDTKTEEPAPAEIQRGSETILLVEDDEMVRKLAHRGLLDDGYTVLEACDGPEAIQRSQGYKGQVDLLLTDVVMPGGIGGHQLAEQLTAHRPEMKVIYMSGYTDDTIVRYGILGKDLAFIQKPFTMTTLTRKVRQQLDEL